MRQKFTTRKIILLGPVQRDTALAAISNALLDAESPLEVVIRERVKTRSMDANAALWAGPMKDIAEQAWSNGKQYDIEIWHEYMKRSYLPEDDDPEIELLAKEGYKKWDYAPDGTRILVGSTTQLTKRGFAQYRMQVEAFGAILGVMFSAKA